MICLSFCDSHLLDLFVCVIDSLTSFRWACFLSWRLSSKSCFVFLYLPLYQIQLSAKAMHIAHLYVIHICVKKSINISLSTIFSKSFSKSIYLSIFMNNHLSVIWFVSGYQILVSANTMQIFCNDPLLLVGLSHSSSTQTSHLKFHLHLVGQFSMFTPICAANIKKKPARGKKKHVFEEW